jgi:hypothetical protein
MNWQVAAWQAAVFGGLITAFLAVVQATAATRQRRRELRWKQAEVGRDLMDKLLDEPLSNATLLMLDSNAREYRITDQDKVTIRAADMLRALDADNLPEGPSYEFVRDAFDTFYYYLDRFEHFIQVGLTRFEDVKSPIDYYIDYLAEDKALHIKYIALTRYTRVSLFLERFENWRVPRATRTEAPSLGLPAVKQGIGASTKARSDVSD